MVALKASTHTLLDGAVKVYRRGNSNHWQATFKIDQHWIRVSTGKRDLEEAKLTARDQYLDYSFRAKHQLPIVTKRFADVANLAIADMQRQLDAGAVLGISYTHYCPDVCRASVPTRFAVLTQQASSLV